MSAAQTTQRHFLSNGIIFQGRCSATGTSVAIGSTFDLTIQRRRKYKQPLLSTPPQLSFITPNGCHKGKELTLTVLEVLQTHICTHKHKHTLGLSVPGQPALQLTPEKRKNLLSSACSCLGEEHNRKEDRAGEEKWTDSGRKKKKKAQSQSTDRTKTKGYL